jgi:hypothetical protein
VQLSNLELALDSDTKITRLMSKPILRVAEWVGEANGTAQSLARHADFSPRCSLAVKPLAEAVPSPTASEQVRSAALSQVEQGHGGHGSLPARRRRSACQIP